MTGLVARVVVERGHFRLDLPLSVAPARVTALVGPNGSGKSTALGALAGLIPMTAEGTVRLGDRVLDGPGVHVPTAGRRCGLVFQDHRLFGHLSARENVAFGLRATGAPARDARAVADDWLDRLGLADHAGVRADRLSGGQAQRVALARALAADPDLLLLDEPFAALDTTMRGRVRAVLREELDRRPRPVVLVTHDRSDALDLADAVLALADGRPADGHGGVRARATGDGSSGTGGVRPLGRQALDQEEPSLQPGAHAREPAGGADIAARSADPVALDDAARRRPAARPTPDAVPAAIAAVVLTGGTARRLGGVDKTGLDVGGRAIVDRLLHGLPAGMPVVVVGDRPAGAEPGTAVSVREDPVRGRPAVWVREDPVGGGPAAALAAGARAVPEARVLVVLAGDQPFAAAVVPRLIAALAADPDADAAQARTPDGRCQPLLAAYRRRAIGDRLDHVRPGDRVRAITDGLVTVPVPVSADEGLDVDDPGDLARARAVSGD